MKVAELIAAVQTRVLELGMPFEDAQRFGEHALVDLYRDKRESLACVESRVLYLLSQTTLYAMVCPAFVWGDTPEGYKYWSKYTNA